MLASEILEKTKIGDKIFVIKPIEINWKNIRFSNTSIAYAEYMISASVDVGFWSNNSNVLKCIQTNEGTKNYLNIITSNNTLYQCFFTKPSRKASSFRAGMDRLEIRNLI